MALDREDYLNNLPTSFRPVRGAGVQAPVSLSPDVLAGVQERLSPWTTGNTDAGGIGGFVMKTLSMLDMPRSAISSTIQETVDLFQGEGFSASDWLQQTRQHHGFGDIIADMGIDAGLGGWGNRIIGFVGDVATDPLMWLGGMNVYSRARGARGFIEDITPRIGELKKIGKASDELKALEAAVVAASKGKSVSAARNELIRNHADVGAQLVKDLGIDTGLKFRVPGTGPVLGRMSRWEPFVDASSARRASQVPAYTQRRLAESLSGESLDSFIRTAARKEAFDKSVDPAVQQVARRAAYMPVEFSVPVLGGFFGTIQALPGSLAGRTAVTRFGQAMGQKFGTTQDNMVAKLARSDKPEDVIFASIVRSGNLRGNTMGSRWGDIAQSSNERFLNNVGTRYSTNDSLIGRISLEILDDEAEMIVKGTLPADRAADLARKYPGMGLQDLAAIRSLWQRDVNKPLTEFLEKVYGERIAQQFKEVILSEGGYSPHSLSRNPIGGFKNSRELLENIFKDIPEGIPAWVKGILEPDVPYAKINTAAEARVRMKSRHMHERSFVPAYQGADGKFVRGTEIKIPYKDDPSRILDFGPDGLRRKIPQLDASDANARRMVWGPDDPRFNMSTTEQINWALRETGWINNSESVYEIGYAARQNGYQSSMTKDIQLAVNENYLADNGIMFHADNFKQYYALMEREKIIADKLSHQINKLDPRIKSRNEEWVSLATVEDGLKHTFKNTRRWREQASVNREAAALGIDEILKPLDDVLDGTVAPVLNRLVKTDQVSEDALRLIIKENGQTLAEGHQLVDELAALRTELDSLLARAGLQPPETAIVREADGSFSVYHGLEDPASLSPAEELLYGKALNENLDTVRELVPIMKRLQTVSARADLIDEGLVKLNSVVEQLETLAPDGGNFISDIGAKIADDIDFIKNSLIPDISAKARRLMLGDETVQSIEGFQKFLRGDYNQYYPSQLYRNSEEMFDSFDGVIFKSDGTPSSLGSWFKTHSHGIPKNREQLDSLNGFASHPRAAELQKISEDALKLREETGIYISVNADFEDHSIGWTMRAVDDAGASTPLSENPVNVEWSVAGDTRLGSVVSDAAMRTGISESKLSQDIMSIVGRWMNNTVLLHADMSGRVLTAMVESETAELLWKNLISLDGNLPLSIKSGRAVDVIFPEPTDVLKQSAKGNAQLDINMRPIEDFFEDIEERLLRTDPVGMDASSAEDVWYSLQEITSPKMGISWFSTLDPEDPFKFQRLWNKAFDDEALETGIFNRERFFDEATLLARRELQEYMEEINFTTELVNVIKRRINMDYRRYNNYGRSGFRASTGPDEYSPMTAQSWIDMQNYNEWDSVQWIQRKPLSRADYDAAGMVPNQQNGLWRINRSGRKEPEVIATTASMLTGSPRLGRRVADTLEWVTEFKKLEEVVGHEFNRSSLSMASFKNRQKDLQKILDTVNDLRNSSGARIPLIGETGAVTPITSRTAFRQTIDSLFSPERGPAAPRSFEEAVVTLGDNPSLEDIHNLFKQVEGERLSKTYMLTQRGEITSLRPPTKIEDVIELTDLVKAIDSKLPAARKAYHGTIDRMLGDQTDKLVDLQRRHAEFVKSEQYWAASQSNTHKRFQNNHRAALQMTIDKELLETQRLMGLARQEQAFDEATDFFSKGKFGLFDEVDFTNIDREGLDNLLREASMMWGGWRIAGDQEFADQVTYALLAVQKMNDREQVTGFLKAYDRVHNWMKAQMVATPGFVTRNIMGGMFNMWTEDIPLSATLRTGKLIQKAYKEGSGDLLAGLKTMKQTQEVKFATQLVEMGAHGGGQAASMVEQNLRLNRKLEWIFGTKDGAAKGWRINLNPADAQFVMYSSIRHANTYAEEMLRLATGVHAMQVGGSLDDAVDMIYRLHFNYGNLSASESNVLKRVFPFYTWSRNNLPLQMTQMMKNPKRYNRLLSLKRNLEYGTEEEGTVPSYFLEPFGFRMPFSIAGSQVYSVPDLPFQDLLRFDPTGVGFVDAAQHILSAGSPMIKVPLEYWGGKQFFKGIPYSGRYQQVPVVWGKIPGLMPALSTIGWAEKNNRGEWKMTDQRIAVMDGLMPYIGRLRRAVPNERRYQERVVQTLVSTLGGMSVRINTPYEQEMQRIRDMIERDNAMEEAEDIRFRQR